MTPTKKRKILKVVSVVTLILSVACFITYMYLAKSDDSVREIGGYVTSWEKISDTEYKAQVLFNRMDEEIVREYTYDTEPSKGQSEKLYYVVSDKDNLLKKKPNAFVSFVWIAVISGVLLVIAGISFGLMKSIRIRKNAGVAKKIKVDEKSMLK